MANNSSVRRRNRTRHALKLKSNGRLRLTVFRSSKHIYAQIIDDTKGATLVAASTAEKEVLGESKTGATAAAAAQVGKAIAERAKAAGISAVQFDRGAYIFHGRVKALADAAREGGLAF